MRFWEFSRIITLISLCWKKNMNFILILYYHSQIFNQDMYFHKAFILLNYSINHLPILIAWKFLYLIFSPFLLIIHKFCYIFSNWYCCFHITILIKNHFWHKFRFYMSSSFGLFLVCIIIISNNPQCSKSTLVFIIRTIFPYSSRIVIIKSKI